MYKHLFDPTILRSYDIRGVFEKTLNKNDAFMLGYFFGITVKNNDLSIKQTSYCNWDGWKII